MSSNTASASPAPGGMGLWVKVIIFVALVIAGYAYIWSLVHSGFGQETTAGVKPRTFASMGEAGSSPAEILVAPTSASEARPEALDVVSFGPGMSNENRAASMPAATAVVVASKPGAGVTLVETAAAVATTAPEAASDAEAGKGTLGVAKSEAVRETTADPEADAVDSDSAPAPAASLPEATPAAAPNTAVSAVAETQPATPVSGAEPVPVRGPVAGTAAISQAAPEPAAVPAAADPTPEAGPAVVEPISDGSDTSEAPVIAPAAEADFPAQASPPATPSGPGDPDAVATPDEGFRAYNYRPRVPDLMREYQRLRAEARTERARGRPGYGPGYGYPGPYPRAGGGGGRGYGPVLWLSLRPRAQRAAVRDSGPGATVGAVGPTAIRPVTTA